MKYELCKQLKDAGFPQNVWDFDLCNFAYSDTDGFDELHLLHEDNDEGRRTGNDYRHRESDKIVWVKCPTLSELIEACGNYFWKIEKQKDGSFVAIGLMSNDLPLPVGQDATPEEAVARLWLAINK